MTCIRPWAPTWLCAKGLKPDSTAMTARIKVGSTLARRPVSNASATSALRGSGATPYFLLNQNATAACCLGSSCGLVAVARSIASGSKLTLAVGAWRSWSQPIRRTSLSVRISGCATKVMIANMTAKPRSAKPLCVISKKTLGDVVRNSANAFGDAGSRCHSSSFFGGGGQPGLPSRQVLAGPLVWVGTLSISCGVVSTCAAI